MKDFTRAKREPLIFKIDDDTFYAAPVVGAELLRPILMGSLEGVDLDVVRAAQEGREVDHAKMIEVVKAMQHQTNLTMQFLDLVLQPESAARFAERLVSTTEPITLDQATEVYQWLISEYSNRPTKPSSSSSSASVADAGPSSTDGVRPKASTPSN